MVPPPSVARVPAKAQTAGCDGGRKGTGLGTREGAPAVANSKKSQCSPSAPRRGWGGSPVPATGSGGLAQLKAMGFDDDEAKQALADHAWDVNKALDCLFRRASSPVGTYAPTLAAALVDNANGVEDLRARNTTEIAADGELPSKAILSAASLTTAASDASEFSDASEPLPPLVGQQDVSGCSDASDPLPTSFGQQEPDQEEAGDDIAVMCEGAPSAPRKELLRASADYWPDEGSTCQLGVRIGSFVRAWPDTQTGNGWMYAELDCGEAGWVPNSVLELVLPTARRWMRVVLAHTPLCAKQLALQDGDVSYVHVDTRTEEGWVFVELHGSRPNLSEVDNLPRVQEGWVPDFCLEEWSGA